MCKTNWLHSHLPITVVPQNPTGHTARGLGNKNSWNHIEDESSIINFSIWLINVSIFFVVRGYCWYCSWCYIVSTRHFEDKTSVSTWPCQIRWIQGHLCWFVLCRQRLCSFRFQSLCTWMWCWFKFASCFIDSPF